MNIFRRSKPSMNDCSDPTDVCFAKVIAFLLRYHFEEFMLTSIFLRKENIVQIH